VEVLRGRAGIRVRFVKFLVPGSDSMTQKKIKAPNDDPEMWANAQRDGRPAEYRWRPLFNAAKFG